MNQDKLRELREYYDTGNSIRGEDGVWETDVEDDPMVTTSMRLPKSLLDWVRIQAEEQALKPTALIRQWIEARHDADRRMPSIAARLTALEDAVFAERAVPRQQRSSPAEDLLVSEGVHDAVSLLARHHAVVHDSSEAVGDLLGLLRASIAAIQVTSDGKRRAEEIVTELRALTEDISHSA
jgi:hypothetical protein